MGLETFARGVRVGSGARLFHDSRHCNIPGDADVGQRKAIRMTTKERAMSLTGVGTIRQTLHYLPKLSGSLGVRVTVGRS